MYKLQLIRKYLIKRRIAWVALVAVMLCTAMVLIVVSVMGGWLKSFKTSFHGMTGDVVIAANSPLGGFPFYQEMIDGVSRLPNVEAAVPIIHTGAMLNVGTEVRLVQLYGYPADIGKVNDWASSLHLNADDRLKQLQEAMAEPGISDDRRNWLRKQMEMLPFGLHPDLNYADYVYGPRASRDLAKNRPGMIISSAMAGVRSESSPHAEEIRTNLFGAPVTLTVVPVKGNQPIDAHDIDPSAYWIVDDSRSRLYALDYDNAYISFAQAQKELKMNGADGDDARCSEVEIKARPGTDLQVLKAQVARIAQDVANSHDIPPWYGFSVQTWMEQQGTIIHAVENEVVLTTSLFGIISMVAVLLILCIFYMIVVEKTKDIGIIKSVGATATGIMSLFLGYGLAIGVVGAALGVTFAYVFVRNINEIHAWLGRVTGKPIWTAETYQFDKIPNQMDGRTVVYVVLFAILSAVIGALIPALRAAVMNPVDALRYE